MVYKSESELHTSGLVKLLKLKDTDIRILTLDEGMDAVDHGIHMGGASSSVVPMVSLFYGGFMDLDVQDPTKPGQDMFVLSKGHAVASMAAVYADLGYFPESLLKGSRSVDSLLNGHPGPLLPGVHIATGPLGQGFAAAQGLAMAGKSGREFNVFCVTGDGELQEGIVWEAFMHAPQKRLDNLCVLIDKNEGQLDNHAQLLFSMDSLPGQIESFGWNVLDIDGTSYSAVVEALEFFASSPRDGKPTAIICNSTKGFGTFGADMAKHKITVSESAYRNEMAQLKALREIRETEFIEYLAGLKAGELDDIHDELLGRADEMGLIVDTGKKTVTIERDVREENKVPVRDKAIAYDSAALPAYGPNDSGAAADVVAACMAEFARDERVVSIDSDLASTSGLQKGVGGVDKSRGINIGIAEANMMCVGEAYAVLGHNVWVSTFCPFFNWQVMRRIAVSYQERLEIIEDEKGWLSDGHGLYLTFLATAPNFETKTNGATHMGNDDSLVFDTVAGLNIIDVSCPNQLVGIMKWVMEGNKGLNYIRIMRSGSAVLYPSDFSFEMGKAYQIAGDEQGAAVNIVSTGRGVHEAVAAAELLEAKGIKTTVWDMPSYDEKKMIELVGGAGLTVLAEQNNGYLSHRLGRSLVKGGGVTVPANLLTLNATRADGSYRYIHSATYGELLNEHGLAPGQIADAIVKKMG